MRAFLLSLLLLATLSGNRAIASEHAMLGSSCAETGNVLASRGARITPLVFEGINSELGITSLTSTASGYLYQLASPFRNIVASHTRQALEGQVWLVAEPEPRRRQRLSIYGAVAPGLCTVLAASEDTIGPDGNTFNQTRLNPLPDITTSACAKANAKTRERKGLVVPVTLAEINRNTRTVTLAAPNMYNQQVSFGTEDRFIEAVATTLSGAWLLVTTPAYSPLGKPGADSPAHAHSKLNMDIVGLSENGETCRSLQTNSIIGLEELPHEARKYFTSAW